MNHKIKILSAPSLIVISFLLLSIFRVDVDDRRAYMTYAFLGIVSIALIVKIWRYDRWIAAFLFLSLISQWYPYYTQQSFLMFHNIFFAMVLFIIIVQEFNENNVGYLMDAMCLIAIANVFYLYLQLSDIDPIIEGRFHAYDPIVGLTANRNESSGLIAFCFPAFFRKPWSLMIPIPVAGLLISRSIGGIAAAIIGTILYLILIKGIFSTIEIITISITIILIITLFSQMYFYLNHNIDIVSKNTHIVLDQFHSRRFEMLRTALFHFYPQRPIFGVGLGHWKVTFRFLKLLPDDLFKYYRYAHCEPVQVLVQSGIGSVIIIFGYLINVLRNYKKEAVLSLTAIVVMLLNSLVHFGFHIGVSAGIGVLWIAINYIQTKGTNKKEKVYAIV